MSRFPSANHAVSWAGLAPGKNESAGHNHSAKTVKGNRHLKAMLVQAAHTVAASKTTICVLNSVGSPIDAAKRQAAVAVARSILVIAYHILRDGTEYQELGVDYFDKPNKEQATHRLVKRLEQLGHQVSLYPAPAQGSVF